MVIEQNVVCPVLIGRADPLAVVSEVVERARTGEGRTVLISGEAGIGKSRLTRAIIDRARPLGFIALQGACFEADRTHPYAPLLDVVRGVASTASTALAAHQFAPAAAELLGLFPELQAIFPDTALRPVSDPEENRRRLFQALTDTLYTLARVQPLLLVIEDVHWSDDATLDLLLHLARRIQGHPIVLVLTFRSDEIGPQLSQVLAALDRARCAAEIRLRQLPAADVALMLQAIFGSHAAFSAEFVAALHGLTEGNPFFVEEILKSLLVAGDLAPADGAWGARPLQHIRVPRTATEAVGRRLAGLSAAARRVASVAAVAGRRFDFNLLQTLTDLSESDLVAFVKELVDAQLVVEESADRFAFRHALTRETIRAQLLARERVALHQAIAKTLARQAESGAGDLDDDLAYHSFEAGAWDAAQRYAFRAADRALALCAPREALQQLERAVIATTRGGGTPTPSLLMARGRAHETLGAFLHANDDFAAALAAARVGGDVRAEWQASYALGMLWAARDYERAGQYRRDALASARAIDDPQLMAHSLNRVGNWYVNREAPHLGTPYHEEALAIFERGGDRRGVAETADLLAMAHHIAGAQDTALRFLERSLELFTALEDRRGLVNVLTLMCACGPSHHSSLGPVSSASWMSDLIANERAVRLAADIGWRAGEAFSRWLLADCCAWRGQYVRALRLARESLAIAEEIEHREWQCAALRVLGFIALDLCAPHEALPQLEAAHAIARRLGSATWIRWTGSPLALALVQVGQPRRAATILDEVDVLVPPATSEDRPGAAQSHTLGQRLLDMARGEIALATDRAADALPVFSESDAVGTPRVALFRARACAALERWPESIAAIDVARAEAVRQDARSLLWRVDALEGAVHLGRRSRSDARRSFDRARAAAAEIVSGLEAPGLVTAFWAGVDHLAPAPPVATARRAAKETYGGLTRRERDTATLIAQGKSNRAIARALGIGERTVEGYVASSLSKLGFKSRTQIAAWATAQGLTAAAQTPSTGSSRR